jgi:predicted anti-sigma-YlaC factor YlaD
MAMHPRPANCERARAWVSLRLDDELSELEEALLAAHLRACAICSSYEESVRGPVVALRARPLEQLEHPIAVLGRRHVLRRQATLARVAATLAVVVGVATVVSTELARQSSNKPSALVQTSAAPDYDFAQLRALRVIQLGGRPPRGSGVGQFGAVLSQRRP